MSTSDHLRPSASSSAPSGVASRALRIATYNVHRCIGADGRYDADRVASVIRELDADVVGLQEVDARYHLQNDLDQIEHLQRLTGMIAVPGATLVNHRGYYGNALLTRHPVREVRHFDLSWAGREKRAALDVELEVEGALVRVIVTHFGLRGAERRDQVRGILTLVEQGRPEPLAIVGDFNEWSFINRTVRVLDARLGASVAVRSFPSRWPLLPLDRLWVQPAGGLEAAIPCRELDGDELTTVHPDTAVVLHDLGDHLAGAKDEADAISDREGANPATTAGARCPGAIPGHAAPPLDPTAMARNRQAR